MQTAPVRPGRVPPGRQPRQDDPFVLAGDALAGEVHPERLRLMVVEHRGALVDALEPERQSYACDPGIEPDPR